MVLVVHFFWFSKVLFSLSSSRSITFGHFLSREQGQNKQLKQQRGAHASGNPLHDRDRKTPNKETHQGASAKASLQRIVARQDGGQAASVLSTAPAALASADCALPPRKKRNKNKFKPDSEPAVASVAPQHGVTNFPSRNTLPMASERTMLANGRTPQESGKAAGRAKKKWKRKKARMSPKSFTFTVWGGNSKLSL